MFSQIAVSGQNQEPRNSNILIWEILPRSTQCSQTPGFEWENIGESQYPQLLPGEHRPKNRTGLNSQIPTENIIHSAVRSTQISPPAPPASRTAYRNASSCESEVGWPYCRRPQAAPRPPTAAPAQGRGSGSVRAAGSTRRTPAATPIRQPPGRAYRQPRTTSHTRIQRMRSQAHR